MNYLWVCVLAAVAAQCVLGSSEIDLLNDDLRLNSTSDCTQQGLYCKSCTELVMCIETEYGWTEQPVASCTGKNSCFQDHCTSNYNVFCNEAAEMPFECHVPGAFPDPFDCQAYHLCVLTREDNSTIEVLKDYRHTCPNEGTQRYRYDAKSTYCKYELNNHCPLYLTPVCTKAGQTGALIENDSIYYVCEEIGDVFYPNLYSCPHGRRYIFERCRDASEITTERPTTSTVWTTTDWTTQDWITTHSPTWRTTTYPPTWEPTTDTPSWGSTTDSQTWGTTTDYPTWGPTTYPPTWGPTTYPPQYSTSRPPLSTPEYSTPRYTTYPPTWWTRTDSPTWGYTTYPPQYSTSRPPLSTPKYSTLRYTTYPPTWDTETSPEYTTSRTI